MNRTAFFASVRRDFGPLRQYQVDGFNALLDAWAGHDPRFAAYALATAYHETARTMKPIKEYGGSAYFLRMYDIRGSRPHVARTLGNIHPGDGAKFCGRGYVQLTGRANYAKASDVCGVALLADPDLAMRMDVAAKVMVHGMTSGWFTGKKLSDYFNATTDDPVGARRIINGTDKAATIAGYHRKFLAALEAAGPGIPAPPDIEPVPPKKPKPKRNTAIAGGTAAAAGGAAVAAAESGAPPIVLVAIVVVAIAVAAFVIWKKRS